MLDWARIRAYLVSMNQSLPIYSILLQWMTGYPKRRFGYRHLTKRVEVAAPDILTASERALATLPKGLILPSVSMIAPKAEWRYDANGARRLVHLFTDGAYLWQGDRLGWIKA